MNPWIQPFLKLENLLLEKGAEKFPFLLNSVWVTLLSKVMFSDIRGALCWTLSPVQTHPLESPSDLHKEDRMRQVKRHIVVKLTLPGHYQRECFESSEAEGDGRKA